MHASRGNQVVLAMGSTARGTALVVDDELSNRVILKALLKRIGYQVVEALNGQQAVDLFGRGPLFGQKIAHLVVGQKSLGLAELNELLNRLLFLNVLHAQASRLGLDRGSSQVKF